MTTTTLTAKNIWEAMDDNFLYYPANFITGKKVVFRFSNETINTESEAIEFLRVVHMAINISPSQEEVDESLRMNGQPSTCGVVEREDFHTSYPLNMDLF